MGKCVSKHPSSLSLHRGSGVVRIPKECVGVSYNSGSGTDIIIRNFLNNNDDDYHCYYYKEQDVDEDDDKENRCNCVNITTATTQLQQNDGGDGAGYGNGKPSLLPQYQMQYFPNGRENGITTAGYGSEIIIKNNSIIYNENVCNATATTGISSSSGDGAGSGNGGLKNAGQNKRKVGELEVDGNESRTGCKGSHPLCEIIDISKKDQELDEKGVSCFLVFLVFFYLFFN